MTTEKQVLQGTWKLVKATRTNLATAATNDVFGANAKGFASYSNDGRIMVMIVWGDRPKPEDPERITDSQRAELFSSMMAYAGTYRFDGKTVVHHIDLSWNEVWSGMKQIRQVKREDDRLVYTTAPSPSPVDGSMGFATVVWEKVKGN